MALQSEQAQYHTGKQRVKGPPAGGLFHAPEEDQMEAATATAAQPEAKEDQPATEPPAAPEAAPPEAVAERPANRLFKWSIWVHAGEGATECEFAKAVEVPNPELPLTLCTDPEHFHAWCRMPNPFQVRDIAEKARAAKARKIRALRDPESDSFVIMEAIIQDTRERGDREVLIQDILAKHDGDDHMAAMREVDAREGFENVHQDAEELERQTALPEDQRDSEAMDQIKKNLDAYEKAMKAEFEKIQRPRKEAADGMEWDEILDSVKRDKIEAVGNETYLHTYNYWQWYVGTLKPHPQNRPQERVFGSLVELQSAAPEAIEGISDAFNELEMSMVRGDLAKNS